jgi:hypothetical protein
MPSRAPCRCGRLMNLRCGHELCCYCRHSRNRRPAEAIATALGVSALCPCGAPAWRGLVCRRCKGRACRAELCRRWREGPPRLLFSRCAECGQPARVKWCSHRCRTRAAMRRRRLFYHSLALAWRLEQALARMELSMDNTTELESQMARLKGLPTESLKRLLTEGIRVVRENLLLAACALAELESRGEKVEGDRYLFRMLRKIASGGLLVDAVVKFAGRPYTLASVERMPPARQAELLAKDDREVERIVAGVPRLRARPTPAETVERCLRIIRECSDPVAARDLLYARLQEPGRAEAS